MTDFDDVIVGSGMAGLAVAALLAKAGRRVAVLEAHDMPGGYAHTFRVKDYFAALRRDDRRAYNILKKKIRERILDVLEASYVPKLREHLVMRVMGTPATNARFCRAPEGNAYGAALTPRNMGPSRRPFRSSLDNLWLANATAGFPSVAGAIGAGIRLYEELTGDSV